MMSVYTDVTSSFEELTLRHYGLTPDEPEIQDVLGSQRCLICGETLKISDSSCNSCGVINSKPIQEAAAAHATDGALNFVALELAKAFGDEPDTGFTLDGALERIRQHYQSENGEEGKAQAFTKWALKQWGLRCAN